MESATQLRRAGGAAVGRTLGRRAAARWRQIRTQARRLLKSLSTPLHCIIIKNSDELQKDEKRPMLCLNSVATSIIFTRRFTASLDHFSNVFSPNSRGQSGNGNFLSQNTGDWLVVYLRVGYSWVSNKRVQTLNFSRTIFLPTQSLTETISLFVLEILGNLAQNFF